MKYGRCLGTVRCTYSQALNKNARLKRSYRGRLYIDAKAKAAEATMETELRIGLRGKKFTTNKVYLDIYVAKPRTNTDAINFIDALADCLKRVIMIDDRYYCIKRLDWEHNRENPSITLKLYQPVRNDDGT